MRNFVFAVNLAAVIVMGASLAHAQQSQSNPLDVIPDKMPYDVPYGAPIGIERARAVIAAASDEAKRRGWKITTAVVDSGGNLVAVERMDGAQLSSPAVAEHKARAAVVYRRDTKTFEAAIQSGLNNVATLDGVIGARGGIPLVENGTMIGAVGCAGGTASQDEVGAKAGASVVNK